MLRMVRIGDINSVAQNQAQTTVKRMRTLELEELGLDDSSLSPGSDFLDSSEQKLLSDESTGSDSSDWIDWTDWIGSKSQSEKSLTAESSEAVPSAIAEEQIALSRAWQILAQVRAR